MARLKRQLEEASAAETVLAASAAVAGGSALESELREEIDRLERENEELERQVSPEHTLVMMPATLSCCLHVRRMWFVAQCAA